MICHKAISLFLVCAPIAAWGTTMRGTAQERIGATATLTASATIHEPIIFRYEISNSSNRPVAINLGFDRIDGFRFEAIGPDGRKQLAPNYMRTVQEGAFRDAILTLAPHRSYSQQALLNQRLDLSQAGRYVVTVRFVGSVQPFPDIAVDIPQVQTFELRVGPRDESRLRATCEALAARARTCCAQDYYDALEELGSIRDVVAVPYLEAAIAAGKANYFRELKAIDGAEVRAALGRLMTSDIDWVARNAKAALQTQGKWRGPRASASVMSG